MSHEFRVIAVDTRLGSSRSFQQTPKYEAQLNREITGKIGLMEGDLIEVTGRRTTAARIFLNDNYSFDSDAIGLSALIRNNARIVPGEMVAIKKADSNVARKIVLAPIGKYLKRSELLKIVAKKGFVDTPFVEGDLTYLRSTVVRYLLGSVTWLKTIKTDPSGIVVSSEQTDYDILPEPTNQNISELELEYLSNSVSRDEVVKNDLLLKDDEWAKIDSLLELGLFHTHSEAVIFFLREGFKVRSDLFDKTASLVGQIKELKEKIVSTK